MLEHLSNYSRHCFDIGKVGCWEDSVRDLAWCRLLAHNLPEQGIPDQHDCMMHAS